MHRLIDVNPQYHKHQKFIDMLAENRLGRNITLERVADDMGLTKEYHIAVNYIGLTDKRYREAYLKHGIRKDD